MSTVEVSMTLETFLRGDYWDAQPEIPTQVRFGAGSTSETVDLDESPTTGATCWPTG